MGGHGCSETYVEKQWRAIVGLELTIERVEGKARRRTGPMRTGPASWPGSAPRVVRERAVAEQMERRS